MTSTTDMNDPHRPLLGEPNAPCRTCGAPLAADQRYCLQCGDRRAEARLPFLDILAGRGVGVPAAATETVASTPAAGGWLARLGTNAAAVAGVGVLLLALGLGVLIGGISDGGTPASSGAPQVISVGGAAPAAAVTSTETPAATDPGDGATTKDKKKSSRTSSSSDSAGETKATNSALKALDTASPEEYQKKAAKLPKTVGTGGKAPPKDNKPAAGGGSFEEIG